MTVAVVCATADLSAVLGLFAACSLIGWRVVLRASMMVFGVLSAIGGGLLASFGSVLLNAADESAAALPGMAARGLILIGVAMPLASSGHSPPSESRQRYSSCTRSCSVLSLWRPLRFFSLVAPRR